MTSSSATPARRSRADPRRLARSRDLPRHPDLHGEDRERGPDERNRRHARRRSPRWRQLPLHERGGLHPRGEGQERRDLTCTVGTLPSRAATTVSDDRRSADQRGHDLAHRKGVRRPAGSHPSGQQRHRGDGDHQVAALNRAGGTLAVPPACSISRAGRGWRRPDAPSWARSRSLVPARQRTRPDRLARGGRVINEGGRPDHARCRAPRGAVCWRGSRA
jgi:hypothetical protein